MDEARAGVAEEASCCTEDIGDDNDEQAVSLEVSIPCRRVSYGEFCEWGYDVLLYDTTRVPSYVC